MDNATDRDLNKNQMLCPSHQTGMRGLLLITNPSAQGGAPCSCRASARAGRIGRSRPAGQAAGSEAPAAWANTCSRAASTQIVIFSASVSRRPWSFGFLIHTLRSLCNAFTNSWASMSASFMLSPKPSDPVKGQFYITERNGRVRGPRPVSTIYFFRESNFRGHLAKERLPDVPHVQTPSPMQRRRGRTSSRSITW